MTTADRVLAEEHLRELREAYALATKDNRPDSFLSVLRARITAVEQELSAA